MYLRDPKHISEMNGFPKCTTFTWNEPVGNMSLERADKCKKISVGFYMSEKQTAKRLSHGGILNLSYYHCPLVCRGGFRGGG